MWMGRKRKADNPYPKYFQIKRGLCFFVRWCPESKRVIWTKIGTDKDIPGALAEWSRRMNLSKKVTGTKVGDLLFRYRVRLEDQQNPLKLAPRTIKDHLRFLRESPASPLIKAFAHMEIDDLEKKHIGDYLEYHPSPVQANKQIQLLSRIFRFGTQKGWAKTNPCDDIQYNTEKPRDRYIRHDEYMAVRDMASPVIQIVMDISYLTGMRQGDILKIRLSDIDDDYLTVTENKTEKKVRHEISPELNETIKLGKKLRRRVTGLYLICNRNGQPYTSSGFKSMWQKTMNKALDKSIIADRFTFHDIRAKHTTDRNEELFEAQLATGHFDQDMVKRYIRHPLGRKVTPLKTTLLSGE